MHAGGTRQVRQSEPADRFGDHPVSLLLERLVAHLVGPRGCADGLPDLQPRPAAWLPWIGPVALQERLLEVRVSKELLHSETPEVG